MDNNSAIVRHGVTLRRGVGRRCGSRAPFRVGALRYGDGRGSGALYFFQVLEQATAAGAWISYSWHGRRLGYVLEVSDLFACVEEIREGERDARREGTSVRSLDLLIAAHWMDMDASGRALRHRKKQKPRHR